MTERRDSDDLIRYLEDGPNELSSFSYDAVRSVIDHKRQRVVIGPWRVPNMNTYARYGIAALAVVAIAVIGFNYIQRPGGVGGTAATPTAAPATANPSPTNSPAPSPAPTAAEAVALPASGDIAPGHYYRYEATGAGAAVRVEFTVPAGWTADDGSIYKDRGEPTEVMLVTWIVSHIFDDVCQWNEDSVVDAGRTADDLIVALRHQGREETAGSWPWNGEIGGLPAEGVELVVPADLDTRTCTDGILRYWPGPGPDFHSGLCCNPPGNTDFVYAVDVNGSTMAVVARHYDGSTTQNREELQSIIDSLQIDP